MVRKGRHKPQIGRLNHFAKLDADKVLHVRLALSDGSATIDSLAKEYGTSFQAVYNIARGKVWSHIGGPLIAKRTVRNLTVAEVVQIRYRAAAGEKLKDIASSFYVWPAVISNIVRGAKRRDVRYLLPCS